MKANRKFIKGNEEAVSPVIAVILMVAITVVLAATVYVWVSGFGQSGSQAKNLSLTQTSCTNGVDTGGSESATSAKFTVVSVSPNFAFANLKVKSATTGISSGAGGTAATAANPGLTSSNAGTYIAAGDTLTFKTLDDTAANRAAENADFSCTDVVNWVDTGANSVVATFTLHT